MKQLTVTVKLEGKATLVAVAVPTQGVFVFVSLRGLPRQDVACPHWR